MRIANPLLAAAVLPAFAVAHDGDFAAKAYLMRRHLMGRQASTTSGTTPPTGSSSSATGSAGSTTPSGSVSRSGSSTVPSISLASTNPTAVPLTAITASQATTVTVPLPSTPAAGSMPTFIPGAPGIPDASSLAPAKYPPLDKIPPTDSPEVKEWIAQVAKTGIVIPDISLTVDGGCPANSAAAADRARCWWTCTGCVSATDITDCPTTMDWGLTYDDGPGYYTPNLLEYLEQQKLKSTFFVVGSRVIQFPRTLQYEYLSEHQIAVHTWSHHPLTQLSNEEIIAELGWSKKAIKDVLGVTPNMMRPPFGDIDNRVRAISLAMGLTPVMWTRQSAQVTFDTDDFNIHNGHTSVYQVLQNWKNIIGNVSTLNTGFVVLEHDLFQESVEVATGYILPDALAHNPPFSIKPVSSCVGRSLADAYIETNDNKTYPGALEAAISAGVVTTTTPAPDATGLDGSGGGGGGGKSGALAEAVPHFALCFTMFAGLLIGASLL